jgi:hypothetical protein
MIGNSFFSRFPHLGAVSVYDIGDRLMIDRLCYKDCKQVALVVELLPFYFELLH